MKPNVPSAEEVEEVFDAQHLALIAEATGLRRLLAEERRMSAVYRSQRDNLVEILRLMKKLDRAKP